MADAMPDLLSACMIVRKDSKNLLGALNDLSPWIDELIVVFDSGTSGDAVELARQRGAKICFFDWCDDFSAARNFSLQYATSEWILCFDDDERIEANHAESLRNLLSVHWSNPQILGIGVLERVDAAQPDGEVQSEIRRRRVKVFRNGAGIRYIGRVYERNTLDDPAFKDRVHFSPLHIVHVGDGRDGPSLLRKYQRDLRLLRLELEESPSELRLLLAYAIALFHLNRFDEAQIAAAQCLDSGDRSLDFMEDVALLCVEIQRASFEPEKSLPVCKRLIERFPEYPKLHLMEGNLHAASDWWDGASRSFAKARAAALAKHKEQGYDRHASGYLAAVNHGNALMRLSRWKEAQDAYQEALEFRAMDPGALKGLLSAYCAAGRIELAENILLRIASSSLGRVSQLAITAEFWTLQEQHTRAIACIDQALQANPNHLSLLMRKAEIAAYNGDNALAVETIARMEAVRAFQASKSSD